MANRVTSVGAVGQYSRSKIYKKDADGTGELCIKGRHVFMGYLNGQEKTNETFDEEGWLHTGDIAKIEPDGYLYITGRLKELIITAGGENIAPIPIEDSLKAAAPRLISGSMVIGDKRKYLIILVTLKVNYLLTFSFYLLNYKRLYWLFIYSFKV
jgi:long-chain-fatty-acid--CoA ligase ACSBG